MKEANGLVEFFEAKERVKSLLNILKFEIYKDEKNRITYRLSKNPNIYYEIYIDYNGYPILFNMINITNNLYHGYDIEINISIIKEEFKWELRKHKIFKLLN